MKRKKTPPPTADDQAASLISRLIDEAVVCTKCGAKGTGGCLCWEQCECGWSRDSAGRCNNCGRRGSAYKLVIRARRPRANNE